MSQTKHAKILIVDDLKENLYSIEHLLAEMRLDCQLVTAKSGQQALDYIQEEDFALVLLDIMMPQMDGYDVVRHIRNMRHRKDLPIIFITADTNPKPLDKFMASGVVGSLNKPVDPPALQRKVKLFLNVYKQRQKLR